MIKKRMTKLMVLGMTAVMGVSTVTGCGKAGEQKKDTSEAEAKTTKATDEKSSKDGDRMTISVLGIDWGTGPKSNSDMEKYWEDYLDMNLDVEWVNFEDYDQKLNTMIAADNLPDVVQLNMEKTSTYYYPIFTQAIDSGLFVNLKPYLFDHGKGVAETNAVMKNWSDDFWKQATYKDGIYIMPRSKSESGMYSGLCVRKDLMEKYGFEKEPTTMDELKDWLIDFSDAATKGEGKKIYGLEFFGDDFMQYNLKAFATAFTGQSDWAIDKDGNFEYMQFNDKYLDFLNWVKDLYDAGAIDPEFSLKNADTSRWKAGNSVASLMQWYNWNQSADLTSNKVFDDSTPDTDAAWCLMPVKGSEGYAISPNQSDIDRAIAINAKCSKKKIEKIMEAFNGTEEKYKNYNTLIMDGVEGVDYKLLPDGTKDSTSDPKYGVLRQEGYVGGWNQIFLKTDANQIQDKFMRPGAKRASDENIKRAEEIKKFIYSDLKKTGIKNEAQNLQSDTYNKQWDVLTDDVGAMCSQYIMGKIGEKDWKNFVKGIVTSPDYKAIQKEFKADKKAAEK